LSTIMMMSFGSPFARNPMIRSGWMGMPCRSSPYMMDDFFNLDREFEDVMWGGMHQPFAFTPILSRASQSQNISQAGPVETPTVSEKKNVSDTLTTQPNKSDEGQDAKNTNPEKQWSEVNSSFCSVRQGPHVISRRTVRHRDATGRDDLLEDRFLDGRVSRRTTDMRKESAQPSITHSGESVEVMGAEEFDKLWEQNQLVQQLFNPSRKTSQIDQSQTESTPAPEQVNQTTTNNNTSCDEACTTTTTTPDFTSQLQQIAQLGLPCDSSTYHLLQVTRGSVERTVMGLLCLQQMKQRGYND